MTALEMQQLFETELQVMSPIFNDSEKPDTDTIFRYINDYQKQIVKELFEARNFNLLKKIITNTAEITPTNNSSLANSVYYTFTNVATPDFLYYINSRSNYTRTYPETSSNNYVYNEEIDKNSYNQFLTTNFNKPFFRIPKSFVMDNTLNVISDAYTTITEIIITYIKNPVEIGIEVNDCELDESVHRAIVIGALNLYIQQKTQLASNTNKE